MINILPLLQHSKIEPLFLMAIRMTSLVSKFVLTLFIARYMGFEDLGVYGLIASATFIVPTVVGLGIMHMKTRDAVMQAPQKVVHNIYLYGRYSIVVYALLFMLSALIGHQFNQMQLALLVMAVIFAEHFNNDWYFLLLNVSKPLAANILHFVRTTIWICTFMVAAFFYEDLRNIEILVLLWFYGSVAALFGFFIVTKDWPWSKRLKFPPLLTWLKSEVKPAKAIYVYNVINSFLQYIGNFFVSVFLGLELTGVYVYFMQIINALSNLLRTGVIQTTRPKLINAREESAEKFRSIYLSCRKSAIFFALLMVVFAVPSIYVVTLYIVDKPLVLEWFPVFAIMLMFFVGQMLVEVDNLILYSNHRDDLLLRLNVIGIFCFVVLSVILVPVFSLWGAAAVVFFVAVIQFFIQRSYLRDLMAKPNKQDGMIKNLFISAILLALAPMPTIIKRFFYTVFFKWEIHKTAEIGISFIRAKHVKMGPYSSIKNFNVIRNLELLEVGEGSMIGKFNNINAIPLGSTRHFVEEANRKQAFIMGKHTDIVKGHFFDCNDTITIGDFTIIAGFGTAFFTHSINVETNRQETRKINIGSYCMIGAKSVVTRGGVLPDYSILAANSTLHKPFDESYMIYSGVPAKPMKKLEEDAKYFSRTKAFVD